MFDSDLPGPSHIFQEGRFSRDLRVELSDRKAAAFLGLAKGGFTPSLLSCDSEPKLMQLLIFTPDLSARGSSNLFFGSNGAEWFGRCAGSA